MTSSPCSQCFIRATACIAFVCLCVFAVVSADAQSISTTATIEKLKQPVHFSADNATLESIADQLSQQTGLRIEAAPSLRDHRSTLHFDGDSAETLLATLAELNEWKWQEERDGRIVISRELGRRPGSLAEVPPAIQRAIAKDVRRYLYVDRENKVAEFKEKPLIGLTHDADGNPQVFERLPGSPLRAPLSAFEKSQMQAAAREKAVTADVTSRINGGAAYTVQELSESLKPTAPKYKPVKYKQLTAQQQELLTARLLLPELKMLTYHETRTVTYNCLQPYFVDIDNLEVVISGNVSIDFLWTTIENGESLSIGFGQQIQPDWVRSR